jgi:hypothetical protein
MSAGNVPESLLNAMSLDPRPCRALVEIDLGAYRIAAPSWALTLACPVCPPVAVVNMTPVAPVPAPWSGYCYRCCCLIWSRRGPRRYFPIARP